MICCAWLESPLGKLLAMARDGALAGLWLEGQRHFAPGFSSDWTLAASEPVLLDTAKWLEAYFQGNRPDPRTLPLAPAGSAFQQRVWHHLLEIPYGSTVTYGELARQLGTRGYQAVGQAVGRNPISIVIPCHRVVGSSGALTGYAGGPEKKQWLLIHEQRPTSPGD